MTLKKEGIILTLSLLLGACSTLSPRPTPEKTMENTTKTYPPAQRQDIKDDFYGQQVADPYRWLESPRSAETKAFIAAQNERTEAHLNQNPHRQAIHDRAEALWSFQQFGQPKITGDYLVYTMRDGLENQPKFYRRNLKTGAEVMVFDPNTLSEDGTKSITTYTLGAKGKYLAYGVSDGGSDWNTWSFKDLNNDKILDDELNFLKFSSVNWLPDGSGAFYSRYPQSEKSLEAVNGHNKLYFHRLGTDQSEDILVFERPDMPQWGFYGQVSDDGRHVIISVTRGTEERNLIYLVPWDGAPGEAIAIVDEWKFQYNYLGQVNGEFFFFTDEDAPHGRVMALSLTDGQASWREVVAESTDTIENIEMAGNKLLINYLHHAQSRVSLVDGLSGEAQNIDLPGIGSVTLGTNGDGSAGAYFLFENFHAPQAIYHLDLDAGAVTPVAQPQLTFDPEAFTSRQVFYPSKDGTQVPMFIIHRKDIEPNAQTPTLLYGYGGFNIPLTPGFKVSRLLWMEMGGVLAVANLRGGGEYGRDWHEAGTKLQKQNVFDDFIAAGDYLVENGLTSPAKLAIQGRSNGGLLVGACLLQRPDLFGAALPGVGVLDMLRYHKFTIGWAWASDYGTVDDEAEFNALYAYSPVHNVVKGQSYPATMITTAERDDRVVPAHSYKFAAALQYGQGGDEPILLRVETRAGHGTGKPVKFYIDELTDELTFLATNLDMSPDL